MAYTVTKAGAVLKVIHKDVYTNTHRFSFGSLKYSLLLSLALKKKNLYFAAKLAISSLHCAVPTCNLLHINA